MHSTDAATSTMAGRKPREDEIDAHGVTHPGKVRKDNQDHFLLCSLRKQLVVRLSSIPEADGLMAESERLASLAMVADGVGGAAQGETASRVALQAVTRVRHPRHALLLRLAAGGRRGGPDRRAPGRRRISATRSSLRRGEKDSDYRGMATTLTLYLGVWPRGYLLQVGDSRCYLLRDGELTQITRDQTMAQEMVDLGVMKAEEAAGTRLAHTLTSSIGGPRDPPQGHPLRHELGPRAAALQRRAHPARLRRPDPGRAPLDDVGQAGLRDAAAGGAGRRRQRQHHGRGGQGGTAGGIARSARRARDGRSLART